MDEVICNFGTALNKYISMLENNVYLWRKVKQQDGDQGEVDKLPKRF